MTQSAKRGGSQEPSQGAPRRGWPRAAAETALGPASSAFARAGFNDATLLLRWDRIVGPQIARLARPLKWQDGPEGAVLTLKCEAGAAVLLQHQTRALIERLNAYLGAGRVYRLKFVPGRLPALPEPPNHPVPGLQSLPHSVALPEALARLAGLRARLKARRPKRTD
jgi:hypothetical protein